MFLSRHVFNAGTFRLFQQLCPAVLVQASSIYSEEFLKINQFREKQQNLKQRLSKVKNNFHEKLSDKVRSSLTDNELNFDFRNVEDLVYFCHKKRDLDLVISASKYLIENGHWPKDKLRGFGTNLMRLIYVLDDTTTGLELISDSSLEPLFGKCGFAYFILMNKLVELKQYDSVVVLFERQIPYFTVETSSSSKSRLGHKTPIPFDQASLVLEALMLINSKESFEKLKELLNFFEKIQFQLCNILVARSFLLAINQNDPEFGLKLMYNLKLKNLDHSLARNLTVIGLCRMNLLDQAFKVADLLRDLKGNFDNTKFIGRFFPMTLKSLEEAVKRAENAELSKRFDEFEQSLVKDGDRMYHVDLKEYCKHETIKID